ncbi:MAG: PHP domain-containing protein [Anaerolineae bacterium]
MALFPVDLHTHTTASDGRLSPAELVQRAARRGVRVLGIADHDTLDGIPAAQAAGAALGVEIVPAIEFSTRHEPAKHFMGIHLLGYFVDPTSPPLQDIVQQVKDGRIAQKKRQVEILQSLGFDISVEAVFARAGGVPGRPHIAAELMARYPGRFESIQQVFDELLGSGRRAHVRRPFSLSVGEAIAAVRAGGGLPVLAHPAAYEAGLDPELAVRNAAAEGIGGVEVYYPYGRGHRGGGSSWVGRMEQLARELKLLPTGGTDFHGRPDNPIDLGDVGLTERQYQSLLAGWQAF